MEQAKVESLLRFVLRWIGTVSLPAVLAVVMPYSWMDAVHRALGLGALPAEPVVGYLARSLSAFYALLGGLMWTLSFDVQRHRPTICYLGVATIALGAMLTGIDWAEGLPRWWRLWEGPWVIAMGAALTWLAFGLHPRSNAESTGGPG